MGMAEWYNKILLDMYTNPYTLVYCLCSAQSKLIANIIQAKPTIEWTWEALDRSCCWWWCGKEEAAMGGWFVDFLWQIKTWDS